MPDTGPASEFGGKVRKNRTQPPPHVPTPSERLMLMYTTGDESGLSEPDDGEVFAGLRPYDRQYAVRKAEGVLEKGQEWERLQAEGAAKVAELAASQPQDEG